MPGSTYKEFQSTFPRGERRKNIVVIRVICYFNPRSRVGNDQYSNGLAPVSVISIHVPAWGTTIIGEKLENHIQISIHVPAWGTTNVAFNSGLAIDISIHVPAWGTTGTAFSIELKDMQFQSTFPRGERRAYLSDRKHSI